MCKWGNQGLEKVSDLVMATTSDDRVRIRMSDFQCLEPLLTYLTTLEDGCHL